jgi:hypothetical protein
MKIFSHGFAATFIAFGICGCAITVPTHMTLSDPIHRKLIDNPGKDIDAMRRACAETMLNASPVAEASEIEARVEATGDQVIIGVDAVLENFGFFHTRRPVSYRCEYREGKLFSGRWTRGLD